MELLSRKLHLLIIFAVFFTSCNGEVLESLDSSRDPGNFCPHTRLANGFCPNQQTLWDFSQASDYTFSSNFVEVSSGAARLKNVDTEFAGSDFQSGSHVGSAVSSSKISILTEPSLDTAHVNTILPNKSANLVAYWRMDGDFTDVSGKENHGTSEGGITASGLPKVGVSSANFDGSDDYINIGDKPTLRVTKFTISSWVNHSNLDGNLYRPVITQQNSTGTRKNFLMAHWRSGAAGFGKKIYVQFTDSAGSIVTLTERDEAVENQWILYTTTFDGTNLKLYRDGIEVSSLTTALIPDISTSMELLLGDFNTAASVHNLEGRLDEVSIWNTDLDKDEVLQIYEAQSGNYTELSSSWTPKYSDLVGYWKMDGNWQDSSPIGTSTGTRSGTGDSSPEFLTPAKVGSQAGAFDGVDDAIELGTNSPFRQSSAITYSFWMKKKDTSGRRLMGTGASGGHGYGGIVLDDTYIYYIWTPTTPGSDTDYFVNYNFNLNEWYHVAISVDYDNENITVYINGDEVSGTLGQVVTNWTPVTTYNVGEIDSIGGRYVNSWQFNNTDLDDIGVWSTALSSSEVTTIYNRQKQKYAASYNSPIVDMGTAQTLTSLTPKTELPFGKELVTTSESSLDYTSMSGDLSLGLVGYWPLNETSADTAPDIAAVATDFEDMSNNSNHGVETGTLTYGKPTIISKGAYFDGSSRVEMGDIPALNLGDLSISLWMKPSNVNLNESLFGKNATTSTGYWLRKVNKKIEMWGVNNSSITTSDVLEADKWFHVIGTRSGTTLSIYINGEFETSSNLGGSINPDPTGRPLTLGRRSGQSSEFYTGLLDEAALWNRALTPNEIQQLYRRGANRVKYQTRICTDSTCSTEPEWIGAGGDGTTYFSELFNRTGTNLDSTFAPCDSSGDNICSDGEFSLLGPVQADQASFLFTDFPALFSGRYFQYRVLMEAEENMACNGGTEPCLPTLTAVNFSPSNLYYAGSPNIESKSAITIAKAPVSVTENKSGSCNITYQFSTDGSTWRYHNGANWIAAVSSTDSNSAENITGKLKNLTTWPSSLYMKAFLNSDGSESCQLDQLTIK